MGKKAVILGTFDGVHEGHRAVIKEASGYESTALSFRIPPKAYFDERVKLIMTADDRCRALKKCGVNQTVLLDFSSVKNTEPWDFLENIREKYSPQLICCGYDYKFGKNAGGNIETLKLYCEKKGILLRVAGCVSKNGNPVSSTFIRNAIACGKTEIANSMLFEKFGFCETVISGDKRGRTIGFPTINQPYPDGLVLPPFGVYKTEVTIDKKTYKGVTDLGVRPTYKTDRVYCETYIDGYCGNAYGKQADLRLCSFIRPERRFESVEQLKAAIENDAKAAFE